MTSSSVYPFLEVVGDIFSGVGGSNLIEPKIEGEGI